MCTVSFLPLENRAFLLTSNRDESPDRNAEEWFETTSKTGEMLFFPKDPKSGGTWICVSNQGRMVCLLNGAYEPFDPDPKYQVSRGTIVLDFFNVESYANWEYQVDLSRVAPFTLVIYDGERFIQLVWNGQMKHIQTLDQSQTHFWSSVTLYPPEVRQWRKGLFTDWSGRNIPWKQNDIMAFHTHGGQGDKENDFVMNRDEVVKTLSVTSVLHTPENVQIQHRNLETGAHVKRNLHLRPIIS